MAAQTGTRDHGIVAGGSIGGLLAARVLSEHFSEVTLVERDVLPDGATARRGVPQGRHPHGLLARGREALEVLFPGLTDELLALGVPATDLQSEFRWVNGGRLLCQAPSGLLGLGVSRLLLEDRIRARVRALPNVQFIEGCDAAGLVPSADGRGVRGLRILRRAESSTAEQLDGDLIVDATGRGSRAPQWLGELGYPSPPEDQVHIGLAYATRSYRRDPGSPGGVAVAATPDNPRGGVMIPQEDDRWIVTFGGILGDAAPLDHDGYSSYAATLPSPLIHEVIRDAEPLSDALRFRYPVSERRRYERLRRFPQGFLVFGDAICSFNPVYGQGMSVAAVEALRLADCLSEGREQLARRFFLAAKELVDIAWDISIGGDLRFPGVVGPRTPKVRAVNAYLERLHVAAESDPEIGRAFLRVVNLLDSPQRLLAPGIALRVWRGSSGRRDLRGIDRASTSPAGRRPEALPVGDRSAD